MNDLLTLCDLEELLKITNDRDTINSIGALIAQEINKPGIRDTPDARRALGLLLRIVIQGGLYLDRWATHTTNHESAN
ncbi:MAG: hypothetical protein HIU84_01890 [Acidobacteria bacterium]|nr:hypothetical protein [Acidobacteriota bacterium]